MTTIVADLKNIAGVKHVSNVVFRSGAPLRRGGTTRELVSEYVEPVKPVNGVVTAELIPGPAILQFGGYEYPFTVPADGGVDVDLWPLVEAYVPYDPPVVGAAQEAAARAEAAAIRAEEAAAGGGGGGQSLVPDPNDPDTYIVTAGGGLAPDPNDPDTFVAS